MSYANPQGIKDFDQFLDMLPARAGLNGIIAASVVWMIAGGSLLFVYTKSVDIQEVQKELTQAEALRPTVPVLSYSPVPGEAIKPYAEKIKALYPALQIEQSGSAIKVSANSTRDFALWRAAINDIGFGGSGWLVRVNEFCAGRECAGGALLANFSIQQLDIKMPEPKTEL